MLGQYSTDFTSPKRCERSDARPINAPVPTTCNIARRMHERARCKLLKVFRCDSRGNEKARQSAEQLFQVVDDPFLPLGRPSELIRSSPTRIGDWLFP